MLRKVRLQQLPRNTFEFACFELYQLLNGSLTRNRTYLEKFHWANNLKQLAFRLYLRNPGSKRIQHFGLRGSVGSGKSTTAIAWFYELMDAYPGITILVMRKTIGELITSTFTQIRLFNERYNIQADYRVGANPFPQITYANGSRWVFRSAESVLEKGSSKDTAVGLGSTEFSGALLEEANQIPLAAVDTVAQRLREPSGVPVRLIAYIFNPTTNTHWAYKRFHTKETLDPAVAPDYNELKFTMEDNAKNLPEGFIESQYALYRNKPSLFNRMILGEYGPEINGDPIYGPYFSRQMHVAKESFIQNWVIRRHWEDGPICLCFDFGFRHPALVVFQDVQIGTFRQVRILAGWLGDSITLKPFAEYYKDEIAKLFPNADILCFADPAGENKDPRGVTEEDAFDVLRSIGLNPKSRKAREEAGVDLIIALLQKVEPHKTLGPQPAVIVEPDVRYTKDIQDMFEIGFCQDRNVKQDVLSPVDDNYYIHYADAIRYGIINRRSLRDLRPGAGNSRTRNGVYKRMEHTDDGHYFAEPMTIQDFLDSGGDLG